MADTKEPERGLPLTYGDERNGGYFAHGLVSHRDFFFMIVYTTGMKLTRDIKKSPGKL